MASNKLPTNAGQILGLANKMLAGLNSLGTTLRITQVTPAMLQGAINDFADADDAFNAARSAAKAAGEVFHNADDALTDWLGAARKILAIHFGNRWSTAWAQAGFIDHSTAVPRRIEDRITLGSQIASFLTANPTYEAPSTDVTAAKGRSLYGTAVTTQQIFLESGLTEKTRSDADTTAKTALTDMMWTLIRIIDVSLSDNDPRWLAFGLNIPATNTAPGQPVHVTAHGDDTGAIVVQCDAVPLATRYRWRTRLVGLQEAYTLACSTVDPIGAITTILPGEVVEIIVQAVNGDRQGVASEPVIFTMPGAASAEVKRATTSTTASGNGVSSQAGNGNGGEHSAHARKY